MKKKALWVCIGLCCLSLTGCLDIVQHITRKSDGTVQNTISITVAKAMLEIGAAMMGQPSPNDDELFNEFDEFDMDEYESFAAKIVKINNPVNIGYLIDMNIDYQNKEMLKALNTRDIDFVPKYEKKKMTIYVGTLQDSNYSKTDNEMMQMFLATCRYRLLVNKSGMPSIGKVILKSAQNSMQIGFLDLYDEYLIDIPMSILFEEKVTIELY